METREEMIELHEKLKGNYIFAWKYDFLLTKEFLSYFTNPESVFADHSKMALGAAHLGYSEATSKFELVIRDYLFFEWLNSYVNQTERINYSELWIGVRDRSNKNNVDLDLEQLLQEEAEETSPDEIVAAIIYCTIGAERLCTGFFVSCCENGMIGRLLLRLKEVRKTEITRNIKVDHI